jgi:hypothetical protein
VVELASAAGPVTIDGIAMANGSNEAEGEAGRVVVTASGDVVVNGRALANGRIAGDVTLSSSTAGITINGRVAASGGNGGAVSLSAATLASVDGIVEASGTTRRPRAAGPARSTSAAPTPASVRVQSSTPAAWRPGGTIHVAASAGDLLLEGTLLASTNASVAFYAVGGTIEGTASGDLTASGVFQCLGTAVSGGCIGLSAGGTLDTSGGTFDKAIVSDCP